MNNVVQMYRKRNLLLRSGPNVINLPKLKMGGHIFERRVLFAGWPNSECNSCIQEMQEQPSHYICSF